LKELTLFTGHYSVSFAAKSAEKRIPLWLLFVAVQFIDVLWSIFVLLGIEKVRIVPGITASNALDLYYMPYTHSLLGVLCWSALAYAVCQFAPSLRGRRIGLILSAAVFSHWILDLIVHRPDLALYDSVGKMGFGWELSRSGVCAGDGGVVRWRGVALSNCDKQGADGRLCCFSGCCTGVEHFLLSATDERSRHGDHGVGSLMLSWR